jgi:tetraacyldisaccharide 4'-kinase
VKPHPFFFPLALLYGAVIWLRNLFFDIGILKTIDVGVPVISVGNLTAGGTGKTPVVKEIAALLTASGKRVAVVSRGYGRESSGTVVVSDGKNILTDTLSSGDEPMMIARSLPNVIVISDEDRVRGARKAIDDFFADVIVLDDGFQHRRIKRTKDIVLMDAKRMPFDTMLLPAGYRREPMSSLDRADAVLVTKANGKTIADGLLNDERISDVDRRFSSSFVPSGIRHFSGGVKQSLDILKGHSVILFCGIASPESFRKTVESCGAIVKEMFAFGDHHQFTSGELKEAVDSLHRNEADFILMTEKDAVRFTGIAGSTGHLPISSVVMDVEFHQADQWKRFVLE